MDERRCAGEPVEDVLDAWPHALPGRSPTTRRAHRPQGAGEIEEVRALRLIELEGAGERFEDAGDAAHVSALDPGVVGDADARQDGDFLAAQAGTRRLPKELSPACSGVSLARAGGQELSDLASRLH